MIQLKPDCLIFQTADGDHIPCSAEWVTMELMGEEASWVDPLIIQNASAAVLYYFKEELSREFVSVGEFALALEKALRGFGLTVSTDQITVPSAPASTSRRVVESNLQELASHAGENFELLFFPHLREEIKTKLGQSPQVLRFRGLRGCVKHLAGATRWSRRCQSLNDQIVDYLRGCWESEKAGQSCALVVL